GSGLVYVLIAVALFAALSFTLMRNNDSNEASTIPDDKAALYATQLISYAAQAKTVVDQMYFAGTGADEIDFSLPGTADFNNDTPAHPHIHKIYHPEGGGLTPGVLDAGVAQAGTDPSAGWYAGRFGNVEWTQTTADDVILTAWRIPISVCAKINEAVTGSSSIPTITDPRNFLVDDDYHNGTEDSFQITDCAACDGYQSLCVADAGATMFAFYNILSP
ncbi:hypothetical protein N9Z27_03095, partial [Alphaproteobacteria bacterium]|nr:hypothetical protein [Alphaproteobacteria bacterium]